MPVKTKEQIQAELTKLQTAYDKLVKANKKAFDDAKAWAEKEIERVKAAAQKEKELLQNDYQSLQADYTALKAKPLKYRIAFYIALAGFALLLIMLLTTKKAKQYDNTNELVLQAQYDSLKVKLDTIQAQKFTDSVSLQNALQQAEEQRNINAQLRSSFNQLMENNKVKRESSHVQIENATDQELIERSKKF